MNLKKIFIIALVLLFLLIGTLAVYNLFIKNPPSANPTATGNLPADNGQFPANSVSPSPSNAANGANQNAAALKVKPISQAKVMGATLTEDGQGVKYFTLPNGYLYQSSFEGANVKAISNTNLSTLVKAIWSPDEGKIIGVFSENNKIRKYFYNYANNQSIILSDKVGYVAWSDDSHKIAYQFTDPTAGDSVISLANPDATGWQNIFKTRLDNLIVEWPAKEKISLRQAPSGLAQGILYVINPATGNFNKILSDTFGLSVKWSPRADKILLSYTDSRGRNPKLILTDEQGTQTKDLGLAGLADKCVWGQDDRTIYCALPQTISANAIWPDDYYKGLVILADDFYKINLETNAKTKIVGSTSETGYDAQDLFLSPKEDYLFFTNRRDGLLYRIKL